MFTKKKLMTCAIAVGVLGFAAPVVALTVTSSQIKNSTIQSIDVKNETLVGADIKTNAVGAGEIKAGAVGFSEISSAVGDEINGAYEVQMATEIVFDVGDNDVSVVGDKTVSLCGDTPTATRAGQGTYNITVDGLDTGVCPSYTPNVSVGSASALFATYQVAGTTIIVNLWDAAGNAADLADGETVSVILA